jgi:hypothetical protein
MINGVLAIVAYLERRKRKFPGFQGSPQMYVTFVKAGKIRFHAPNGNPRQ